MSTVERESKEILQYLRSFLKWVLIALVTGTAGGLVGSAFHLSVSWAAAFREAHPWLLWLLPLLLSCGLTGLGQKKVFRVLAGLVLLLLLWDNVQTANAMRVEASVRNVGSGVSVCLIYMALTMSR